MSTLEQWLAEVIYLFKLLWWRLDGLALLGQWDLDPVEWLIVLVVFGVILALFVGAMSGGSSASRRKQNIRSTGKQARSEMDKASREFRRGMRK